MTASLFPMALVLGLLSAIGSFALYIDLPAMFAMGDSLEAGIGQVHASLGAFFIALAFSQLFYGPASDRHGRKAPLYWGMGLFAVASVGCALAPSIEWLIGWRFVQGWVPVRH